MRVRHSLLLCLVLASTPALAEQGNFNLHFDLGVGSVLQDRVFADTASLKLDTTLIKPLGPIAPQVEMFGAGAGYYTSLASGSAFGFGVGARLRLFNDEKGYYFHTGKRAHGTLWGNLYADAHFTWAIAGVGPGFDVSAGTELSLIDGLSVGPFVRYALMGVNPLTQQPNHVLTAGVSFTLPIPARAPAEDDQDGDGIVNKDDKCVDQPEDKDGFEDMDGCPDLDNDKDGVPDEKDKCPNEPEDKDGFQDEDGCPDPDNDQDGVLDGADKCPLQKGPAENNGCPDTDKDGDGVVDRLDQCPDQVGPPENKGCPDTDQDGDTVVDRLDACPAEKGEVDNKGCPWPDQDQDGVPDHVDNCPTEKGPASNQGCPEKEKQLVVITKERLVIKDKVYFDFNKATIQKRSNTMLDQIANVILSHSDIKLVQIEGHTDSTGDAAYNRKLSQDRADAIKAYLVKKKVEAERLRTVGFGPDKPAQPNDTEKGREANRRVEFNIVDQEGTTPLPVETKP